MKLRLLLFFFFENNKSSPYMGPSFTVTYKVEEIYISFSLPHLRCLKALSLFPNV